VGIEGNFCAPHEDLEDSGLEDWALKDLGLEDLGFEDLLLEDSGLEDSRLMDSALEDLLQQACNLNISCRNAGDLSQTHWM
jgi:hypothetical protein